VSAGIDNLILLFFILNADGILPSVLFKEMAFDQTKYQFI
jgi:hypothetical protein